MSRRQVMLGRVLVHTLHSASLARAAPRCLSGHELASRWPPAMEPLVGQTLEQQRARSCQA
jgi:hypothetical protein